MKNKNREGKKLKTHALLTRNSFFILFPYFDISLYPIFWIFFLVPVYIFFLFPLFVLPEGFLTWFLLCRHFVGFLYPIFIFFLVPVSLFLPSFCVARGIFPLFLGCRLFVGFLYHIIVFILDSVKIFSFPYFCSVGRILDTVFNLSFFGFSLPYFDIYFLSLLTFLYFSNPPSSWNVEYQHFKTNELSRDQFVYKKNENDSTEAVCSKIPTSIILLYHSVRERGSWRIIVRG